MRRDVSPIFPAVLYNSLPWRKTCVHLGGLAFFFHFVSVVEMLVQAHRWMPVGVREIESLLGFAVAGLFFLVWWLYDAISLGNLCPAGDFLPRLYPRAGRERIPFSLAACVDELAGRAHYRSAAGLCGAVLQPAGVHALSGAGAADQIQAQGRQRSGWSPLDWLPPLDTLERIALATLEFGFPCMTVGLLIGFVLVQETSLGASYFLDPNILASFAMWVVYVTLLLFRRGMGLRGRRAAYVSGAALVVMMAVWAANFFSQVHRFGPQ